VSAAILTLAATGGASGGGGGGGGFGNHPNAMAWSNLYGSGSGATQFLTVSGVGGGTAPITIANSGAALVYYNHDGIASLYTGGFTVADGDTLGWFVLNYAPGLKSGTITVSSGAFTVGAFTYVIAGNNYF
jgi:hypothetical protein